MQTVNAQNWEDIALRIFRYQAENNPVYAQYIQYLACDIKQISSLKNIPFLPISFFKTHALKTENWETHTFFTSSGTTGELTSRHFIPDLNFYLSHAEQCFTHFFGSLEQYHFLALMPSYLERENSSLVAMMDSFIKKSKSEFSRFYRYNYDALYQDIEHLKKKSDRKIILWGVSFALLDFAEQYQLDLSNCLVFETGGMKGRRKEITREELHHQLKKSLNIHAVYSEYGMTELLSQAYTKGGNLFYPSPLMKVLVRDAIDPFEVGLIDRAGGLNVIDLANFHSISFIETEDAGKAIQNGAFEVLGRLDNSDVRGCNLLIE